MSDKAKVIYDEGFRDGERAATERCYSSARAALRLHAAAALVLVVLGAVALVERTATTYAAPMPKVDSRTAAAFAALNTYGGRIEVFSPRLSWDISPAAEELVNQARRYHACSQPACPPNMLLWKIRNTGSTAVELNSITISK